MMNPNKIFSIKGFLMLCILLGAFSALSAEEKSIDKVKKLKNNKLQKHLLENVDVFGDNNIGALYILGPGLSEEEEASLLIRDFSRDPFFMQNIDREEFETRMALRTMREDKKQVLKDK